MTTNILIKIDAQIELCVKEVLKTSFIEESFTGLIVPQQRGENIKNQLFNKQIVTLLAPLTAEQREHAFRTFLQWTAAESKTEHLQSLFQAVSHMVNMNVYSARVVCEQILSCDRLVYTNKSFWIEAFRTIRKLITCVDYKGVREIMKGARDKLQSFPTNIELHLMPQLLAAEGLIEYIFDRNSCLLPAYFIANEIQKSGPVHWRISKLTSSFVEDFRNVAQMVSIIGHVHMLPIVELFGYTDTLISPWKMDLATLKFTHRGILPYEPELQQPQKNLLRYVLEQPYSKDMVSAMLSLPKPNKQHSAAIEEQLVWLIISAMERTEDDPSKTNENNDKFNSIHWLWAHISSQLIYFVLFQYASFPNIVTTLHEKLEARQIKKGRDYLMWSLLQFISGSIQRNPLSNFMSVLGLFDILYPEKEPLPVPDCSKIYATRQMAPTCIWIHLKKKAEADRISLHREIPNSLKKHYEFLHHLMITNTTLQMSNDFTIVLLCNAYSTNPEFFARPMAAIFETINKAPAGATQPTIPLSMVTLDSLTVHSKMSLIHSIVSHIMKQAQNKNTAGANANVMAPALVETYSRLLVYTEIESLGIKSFLSQLLPQIFKSQAWGILHTLLEMLSFRMHHIQPFYRVQFLSHLHSLASMPHTNQTQIHLCVESTALRLITGLGSAEVLPQLQRYFTDSKIPGNIVSTESEELNRALILTIAQAMHITCTGIEDQQNAWIKELLQTIMQYTPHTWAPHTLQCFPPILASFYAQANVPRENKQMLKKCVEDEYGKFASMTNENDIISHFTAPTTPPLFLCLLFMMVLETDTITAAAYKVLERIGARALSAHLRKLCDYLAYDFANSGQNQNINKRVDAINDLIWKYNVVTLDRLVLCLAIRTQEGNEVQVCFCIIQLLLLKSPAFRSRVIEFVKENSPDHWKQNNWYEKHIAFQQQFREKFSPDESSSHNQLPVYFGNVCLRFLPVLDIVIHRFLEAPMNSVNQPLESILKHLGCLYKFHNRPITYLYHTLHFYERKLQDRPALKKCLVGAIIGSLSDIRPSKWALSEQYQTFILKVDNDGAQWTPDISYYIGHVRRIADTISGKNVFYVSDWRFNEFPNAPAHALYVTCVELLSLPVSPDIIANNLINVIVKGYTVIPVNEIHGWINVVGMVLASLPRPYWSVVYDRLRDILKSDKMVEWPYRFSPFELFNFKVANEAMLERKYVLMLSIAHAVLHHSSIGQSMAIAEFVKEMKPHVVNEYQLIYLCHLFGPFMMRMDQEKPRVGYELTTLLYEMLEQVDKGHGTKPLKHMDSICDLLYHIKYMFVGDMLKVETETIIRKLRPELQMRLRFISHLSVGDIPTLTDAKAPSSVADPKKVAGPPPPPPPTPLKT